MKDNGIASTTFQRVVDTYAHLFARRRFARLNKLMFLLSLRGLGMLNYTSNVASGEEHFLRSRLRDMRSPIVFDVGANIGGYSAAALHAQPNARLFAFEPHPETFKLLLRNLAGRKVEFINAACGKAVGEMVLYDYSTAGSSHASLYQGVIEQLHRRPSLNCTIQVTDLDTFANDRGIDHIDLLKIDTEGYELAVLSGASQLLRNARITAIQFEFNQMNVISRTFCLDFYKALPEYQLYRMVRDGLIPLHEYSSIYCELFAFQNIVAILRDPYQPTSAGQ